MATVAAAFVPLRQYETFLLLLGSAFVPLFGVLLADWLLRGRRYERDDFFATAAVRPAALAAWALGFALYHWLHEPPLGPSWWAAVVERTSPPNLGIGASLPSFASAFLLMLLAGTLSARFRDTSAHPAQAR